MATTNLGRPFTIMNVKYTLDHTKTTEADPDVVFQFTLPEGDQRIVLLAMSFDTTSQSNYKVNLDIDRAPFNYPSGGDIYNPPASSFQLCGNVTDDGIDVDGGTVVTLKSVMSGSTSTDGVVYLTFMSKPRLKG